MYVWVSFCILEHLRNSYMDITGKITSSLGRPSELVLYFWVFLMYYIIHWAPEGKAPKKALRTE